MGAPNWLSNIRDTLGALLADLRYNWKAKVKRFRLHIFAFALFLTGVLQSVDPYALYGFIPPQYMGVVPIAFGIGLWLMRKITEHPPMVTTTYHGEAVTDPAPPSEH